MPTVEDMQKAHEKNTRESQLKYLLLELGVADNLSPINPTFEAAMIALLLDEVNFRKCSSCEQPLKAEDFHLTLT